MPRLEKADTFLKERAETILTKFDTYKPVIDAKVTIDFLFAYADECPQTGLPLGPAITHHVIAALGLCKIVGYKDRVKGLADVEITIDGQWWNSHDQPDQDALLDHELHHIQVIEEGRTDARRAKHDKAGRPKLRCRPHEYEFGWFGVIAARHGLSSREVVQAKQIMEQGGQLFWPQLFNGDGYNVATPSPNSVLRAAGFAPAL